jgi:hypothetical protein
LSYTIKSSPGHGNLTGTPPNLVYTPDPNFSGADNFTYVVSDGSRISSPATVLVEVTPVNDPPIANSKSIETVKNQPLTILMTGADPDGDSLSFTVIAAPLHGKLTGTPPNLTYDPDQNYVGPDDLIFVVDDGTLASAPAAINISVVSANAKVKVRRGLLAR